MSAIMDREALAARARQVRNDAIARIAAGQRTRKAAESLPGRTWASWSLRTRTVLVMLACHSSGDARTLAAQPWESFTDADRVSIAACARDMGGDLKSAASLW